MTVSLSQGVMVNYYMPINYHFKEKSCINATVIREIFIQNFIGIAPTY